MHCHVAFNDARTWRITFVLNCIGVSLSLYPTHRCNVDDGDTPPRKSGVGSEASLTIGEVCTFARLSIEGSIEDMGHCYLIGRW